jgi:hypothetical protein
VIQRTWQGSRSTYEIPWGGETWVLEGQLPRPGLYRRGSGGERFLSLEGLGAPDRRDTASPLFWSLAGVEVVRSRVEATYEPRDWAGLRIRASWSPTTAGNGMDLEIQVWASSVGQLQAIEVFVATGPTDLGHAAGAPFPSWVQPRDRRSAALSYDGREPLESLGRLTTVPLPTGDEVAFPPVFLSFPGQEPGGDYLEMVHPYDVARRIITVSEPPYDRRGRALAIRYGLLGHDLEKGVVVRARLRGLWSSGADLEEASRRAFQEFLEQPLPLGT